MKKYFVTLIAIAFAAAGAQAQDMYFGKTISRNNYYGTARSVGLGGAMTALGGDLGSITYNPAGSAVNDYSQFTISPGMVFSSSSASYDPYDTGEFGTPMRTSRNRFVLPNVALNMVFYPEDSYWLTSSSMGLIVNSTNNYLNSLQASGLNDYTSILGSIAAAAEGTSYENLPSRLYIPYTANQLGEFGPEGSNRYAAANQVISPDGKYCYVPGTLTQTSRFYTTGSKTDIIFNLGYNFLDRFYVGVNVGMPILRYKQEELFSETAMEPVRFPVPFEEGVTYNYLNSNYGYELESSGIGFFGAVGIIFLPTESLRLGASFKSPTIYNISESWTYRATCDYQDAPAAYNGDEITEPPLSQSYNFTTPYTLNLGIAYTIPALGLLSLDYELSDYSIMRFSDESYYSELFDYWSDTNHTSSLFCGLQHSVRAGVEFKPTSSLAVRAGYAFTSDPEKYWYDSDGHIVNADSYWSGRVIKDAKYYNAAIHSVSLGMGYSSPGSFFADFAVRMTSYPLSYFAPYYHTGAYQAYDKDGYALNVGEPFVRTERSLFDAVLTLGWRF